MDRAKHDAYILLPSVGECTAQSFTEMVTSVSTQPEAIKPIDREMELNDDSVREAVARALSIVSEEEQDGPVLFQTNLVEIVPGGTLNKDSMSAIWTEVSTLPKTSQPLMTVYMIISQLRKEAPGVVHHIQERFTRWWEQVIRQRLPKTAIVDISDLHEEKVFSDMMDYLEEEGLKADAINLFNSEYQDLFNFQAAIYGKEQDYTRINCNFSALFAERRKENPEKLASEVAADLQFEACGIDMDPKVISLVRATDIPLLVLQHYRVEMNYGAISPIENGSLWGALKGAFDKLPLDRPVLRVVTKATGKVYTVSRTLNPHGTPIYSVLDID